MEKQVDDGGSAFACPDTEYRQGDPGMSLRDWFAGQALVGFGLGALSDADTMTLASNTAYAIADAMLAARKREGGS